MLLTRGQDEPLFRARRVRARCEHCSGRAKGMCGEISAAALRELSVGSVTCRLRRGDTFLWQGDTGAPVGSVMEGLLKLVVTASDGRERTVGFAAAGDVVGNPLGGTAMCSIVALTDVSICAFEGDRLTAMITGVPEIGRALLQKVSADLARARRWILLLGRGSATARVASLLAELADHADSQCQRIDLPLSRGEMSELLGLTIETVSRKLRCLSRNSIIGLPDTRSFVVYDAGQLRDAAHSARGV